MATNKPAKSPTWTVPIVSWVVALGGGVGWVAIIRNAFLGGSTSGATSLLADACFLAWAVGSIVAVVASIGALARSLKSRNRSSTAMSALMILLTLASVVAVLYFVVAISLI